MYMDEPLLREHDYAQRAKEARKQLERTVTAAITTAMRSMTKRDIGYTIYKVLVIVGVRNRKQVWEDILNGEEGSGGQGSTGSGSGSEVSAQEARTGTQEK